jgi:hypothetical protein
MGKQKKGVLAIRTKKWEYCACGYNWATLFLGEINTETYPSGWESLTFETIKYGHDSRMTLTREGLRW